MKGKQKNVDLMIQNICMYLDSIICNLFVIVASETDATLSQIFDPNLFLNVFVPAILVNNALCGLSTSLFIKTFNSIMKAYAAGIELLLTALLCYLFFAIPISLYTVVAIGVVSYATYLYATSPIAVSAATPVPPPTPPPLPDKLVCQS